MNFAEPNEQYINEKAAEIYAQNKAVGWWDDPDRCIYECLQLVSTEVAEATEGARKDLMDDHLPHHKMEAVELADALIRTLDIGGKLGLKYEPTDIIAILDGLAPAGGDSVGKMHLSITGSVAFMAACVQDGGEEDTSEAYSLLIDAIFMVAWLRGYESLTSIMEEKISYNKNRLDHQRENRARAGGKKF